VKEVEDIVLKIKILTVLRKFSYFWYIKLPERNEINDIALTAVTSKEDMYDDKEEGEETRAVLPSLHLWRAPTPIHWLSLPPFVRFYPHRAERASACVRACVYEGARVLARASCLRAFVWGMCVRAYTREESRLCERTGLCVCVLARGTGICFPRFFSPFRFWRFFPSLFASLSFSWSKRRRVRERYRVVDSCWTFLRE